MIMGLIERVLGRPAAAKTASTSSLLKGLATSPGGPPQRDRGLAALGSGQRIALRWTQNGAGGRIRKSASGFGDQEALRLMGNIETYRGGICGRLLPISLRLARETVKRAPDLAVAVGQS